MTRAELETSIANDLGKNFSRDDAVVFDSIFNEVVDNALRFSNRRFKTETDQLPILASEIRRCVKTIYLSRGSEDVTSQSQSGISSTYDNAMERLRKDIVKNGKRVLL